MDDLTARLLAGLAPGALRVRPPALQPADVALDLYGEEIRGRAFLTVGSDGGELMLRPDFTMAVLRAHPAPGAYAYAGPVWRRAPLGSDRPEEQLQAGVERFGEPGPEADAALLARFAAALADWPLSVATGDMGLLIAAVESLPLRPSQIARLRRHIWRPERFRDLLARAVAAAPDAPGAAVPEEVPGARSPAEIAARLADLEAERVVRLPRGLADLLGALLALSTDCAAAEPDLRALAADLPGLAPAVDAFARRLEALAAAGLDPGGLAFEGSFGRTSMEYYTGFVFGFAAADPALPVIASGGRYDGLAARLTGRDLPALGGIVRPEALALC